MSVTFKPYHAKYVWPSCNFANGNARVVMEAAGIPIRGDDEMIGEIGGDALDRVIGNLMRLVNSECLEFERKEKRSWGRGPSLIECGTTSDEMKRRFQELLGVCVWAQRRNDVVVYF